MPTPRYRALGPASTVDESLFGELKATQFKNSRRIVTGPLNPSDVVITPEQLTKIQSSAIIRTEAEMAAEKEHAARLKEEKQAVAGARKKRMKELEKRALAMAKKSDMEIEAEGIAIAKRMAAAEQMDKNSDTVKLLKSMEARAIAFSVRDGQLHEKEKREKVAEEADRRLDIMMEIDRIKSIADREDAEREKAIKRKEGGKVITEQIEVRRRQKLLDAEARDQEGQAMRARFEGYADEDREIAKQKQLVVEKSRKEVMIANEASIQAKKAAKEAAKKEMEDILIYQAQKDAEFAAREAEEEAAAQLKKERQATLLAQQEKAQNNAGKLDELRARRAAEEAERKTRKAEKEKAAKQRADIKDLLESRAKQAADKKSFAANKAIEDAEEVRQGLMYMEKMDERERRDKERKSRMNEEHRVKLHSQINLREQQRKDGMGNVRDEGTKFMQDLLREESKLKTIRDKMVDDLERKGVDPRYLSEMRNVDIAKILKR